MDNTAPIPAKKPWFSKTVILNTAALVATFIPAVGEWLKANPVELIAALAAVNVLLRFVTSGKISLGWDSESKVGGGGASALVALLGCMGWVCGSMSLTSCGLPEGTSASIYYLDRSSGAKGGLTFADGKGKGTLYVPLLDKDGDPTGRAALEVPIRATK